MKAALGYSAKDIIDRIKKKAYKMCIIDFFSFIGGYCKYLMFKILFVLKRQAKMLIYVNGQKKNQVSNSL